jgi:hypothetical protein
MYYKAKFIPGYKNIFADGEWEERTLPDGSITWQHTSGTMANIARRPDGTYCAVGIV